MNSDPKALRARRTYLSRCLISSGGNTACEGAPQDQPLGWLATEGAGAGDPVIVTLHLRARAGRFGAGPSSSQA